MPDIVLNVMGIILKSVFIILFLCFISCLQGCGSKNNLKDNVLEGYNNLIQNVSRHALSKDRELNGTREFGTDEYTGNYSADYKDFNGKEFIFGGTSLERDNGSKLEVVYQLEVSSGNAMLYWIAAGEEYLISSGNTESTYKFTIEPGDNYIVLEGENFSGTLELKAGDITD